MKLTIPLLLLQLILYLAGNVAPTNGKFVGNIKDDDEGGTITILDIQDDNKTQYLNQNFEQGNYNYGYDIQPTGPVGQFHHENKSPDEIVYGCYGYEGPDNKNHMTFYVSDAWGYRPVRQETDIEIFFPADNPPGTGHHNGKMIRWADLVFPEMCAHFAERIASSTNVVTKTPLQVASPPASVVTKLQSTASPRSPFPNSGQTSPVPSSSFDVIQFNSPSGTASTPFSRLTSISNPGSPTAQQTKTGQNENVPTTIKTPDRTFPNRFGSSTTGRNPNSPSPSVPSSEGGFPSGSTIGSGGPSAGKNTQFLTTVGPQQANNRFSTDGVAPGSTNAPISFSRPISSTNLPDTLTNVNQPSRTRPPANILPSSSPGRVPTSGNGSPSSSTSPNAGFDQFSNSGPISGTAVTPGSGVLPSFNGRPSSSTNGEAPTFSTSVPNNRFTTGNRQTPSSGVGNNFNPTTQPQGTSNLPTGTSQGINRPQTPGQVGSTTFRATARPADQDTNNPTSGSGRVTGSNRFSQTPQGGNSGATGGLTRPIVNNPVTGPSQTTSNNRFPQTPSTQGGNFGATGGSTRPSANNPVTGPSQTTANNRFSQTPSPQGGNFGTTGGSTRPNVNNPVTGPSQTSTNGRFSQTPSTQGGDFGATGGSTRPNVNNPLTGSSQTTANNRFSQTPSPQGGSFGTTGGSTRPSVNSPLTGPSQTTANNRQQTNGNLGGNNFSRSTGRPTNQETSGPLSGTSQGTGNPQQVSQGGNNGRTTTRLTNPSTNNAFSRTNSPVTEATNFGRVPGSQTEFTRRPFNNEKDHSFEATRTSTARPSRPQVGGGAYNNPSTSGNDDEDVSHNVVDNNRGVTPTATGSSTGRHSGVSRGSFNNPVSSTSAPSPTTPALSNARGSTQFLVPNRGGGTNSQSPGNAQSPNGNQDTARPSTPFQGNNRGNTGATFPSTSSPFPRPGSSFFNNPSSLQPSSTNQNTFPTSTNPSGRRPTTTPGFNNGGSKQTESRETDRFNQGTGAPIIPQEPDEGLTSNQPASTASNSITRKNNPTQFGNGRGTTQSGFSTSAPLLNRPTPQSSFGARRPTPTTLSSGPNSGTRQPTASSSSFLRNNTSSGRNQQDSFCETQCNSCKSSNQPKETIRDEDFSQIPGALLTNIPVIFYPDCSANAYSRPAIVPFCPSEKSQCGGPFASKFPESSNFIGGQNVPRNVFTFEEASRATRKIRRGRQPRSIKL